MSSTLKRALLIGSILLVALLGVVAFRFLAPSSPARDASVSPGSLAVTPPITPGKDDLFEDVTARAGINFTHQFCDTRIANIIESNGAGGAWLDFDGDGHVDLFLVNSGPLSGVTHEPAGTVRQPNRLYRNRGNGAFEDVTKAAGLEGAGYGTAAAAADYDNDGFTDLYVVCVGGSLLYHNRGNGAFENATSAAGVANADGTGIGAVFLDVDLDGLLDLFVANYLSFNPAFKSSFHPESPYPGPLAYKAQLNKLYRNLGNGKFEDASESSCIQLPGHRAMSVTVLDCNADGSPDLYLSNDGTPNHLLLNDGKGHFKEIGAESGVAFNAMGEAAGSMAAAIGDCNGDGLDDMFVTRLGYGSLYVGTKSGLYEDRMMPSGLGALTRRFVGWGGNFLDFDNDGDLDLTVANGDALYLLGSECLLLENDGNGRFVDASGKGGAVFRTPVRGRGSAVADYDNDGHLDIVVTGIGDRPLLLKNRGKSGGHWLTLSLEGTRSNRDGFGAILKVKAGGKTYHAFARSAFGFLMQSDRRVHFGLGSATTVETVEITWPSKQVQQLANLQVDRVMKVREPGERLVPGKVAQSSSAPQRLSTE
jgi:hypothetical protein